MRRRILFGGGGGGKPSDSQAGDILFYNKATDKLLIVNGEEWSIEQYPIDSYTPVGIVAVPGYHDVYGDGSCGVVSLHGMSRNNPENGVVGYGDSMAYGSSGYISSIFTGSDVPYVGTLQSPGDESSTVIGEGIVNFEFPSDINNSFSDTQCPHDKDAYYYGSSSSIKVVPSPYFTDETRNPAYYQTTEPCPNNVLCNFDGITISKTLTNIYQEEDYAAKICSKYHTEGTEQGDWYLPSIGELGYLIVKYAAISTLIYNMCGIYYGIYEDISQPSLTNWSCIQRDSGTALGVKFYGDIYYYYKTYNYYARAFLRINENGVVTA